MSLLSEETRALLYMLDDYARFRARTCERGAYQSHDVADVDETLRTEAKVWMEVVALVEEAIDSEGPFDREAITQRVERMRCAEALWRTPEPESAPEPEGEGEAEAESAAEAETPSPTQWTAEEIYAAIGPFTRLVIAVDPDEPVMPLISQVSRSADKCLVIEKHRHPERGS